MGKHTARRTLTALGVAGLLAGGSFLLATSSATAVTSTAKCGGTVSGTMGETVTLKSDAVQSFVVDSVSGGFDFPLLPITKSNKTKLTELFDANKFDPITLTTVPKAAASGVFADDKIALAVVRKIEANDDGKQILSENGNRDAVLKAVESNCSDLTVKASNYVAPSQPGDPASPGSPPSSDSSGPGSGTATPGTRTGSGAGYNLGSVPQGFDYGTGSARAPMRDYGALGFELPGYGTGDARAANPYSSTPGLGQDFGVLGGSGQAADPEVNNAGNAEQIQAASPQDEAIQLPMLLAVVSLACVAAALVRTWVLRRI